MKPIRTLLSSIALLALASTASAGRYDRDFEYAKVVDVQPIYENYQIPETRRVCNNNNNNGNYNGNRNRTRYSQPHSNGGGALLGGIIGGIIGNRFGKGNGRRAATAASGCTPAERSG